MPCAVLRLETASADIRALPILQPEPGIHVDPTRGLRDPASEAGQRSAAVTAAALLPGVQEAAAEMRGLPGTAGLCKPDIGGHEAVPRDGATTGDWCRRA